jgi:hypothetical protein
MAQFNATQASTLSPEDYAQQQAVNRQQQIAAMLMQQSQQQPQGQMVSGRYVPNSFFQNLLPVAQAAASQYVGDKADTKATQLAQRLRNQEMSDLQNYQMLNAGRPAQPSQELAGPAYQGVAPSVQYPAVPADPQAANLFAASSYSPALRAMGMKKLTEGPKWEKAEYTDEKTGKTRQGVINVNSPDPISTFQVGGVKPEMSAYERTSLNMRGAELADQGIGGYGAPSSPAMGGQPTGTPMGRPSGAPMGQPQGQPAFTPSTLPTYQPDPMLSPKQNRELAMEFSKKQGSNVTNAKDSFELMKEAGKILSTNAPSSGFLSNVVTTAGEAFNLPFGARKTESEADASLKMLSGALTMKQPRFEGPQGVLDVILYQKLAGDLGNPNIPNESRLATMKQMVTLQKKYFPNGDWDSIDTELKDTGKVSIGPKKEVDFGSLPQGRR